MQPTSYSFTYRTLHWLTALFVFILIPVGLYMASLPDNAPNKAMIYELHKSFGFIVLLAFVGIVTDVSLMFVRYSTLRPPLRA